MNRYGMAAWVALAWAAVGPAHAEIYTWVDKNGIVNVSNEAPPEGARVTKVVRTAPKDPAVEAAARQAEVRALRDRVDQLAREVEQSREALPPPYAAPPVVAMAPPAPPAPTVVVTVVNQPPAQPDYAPASSMCDYTFGGCGFYSPGYTYYVPPFQRGFNKPGRGRFHATRPGVGVPPPLNLTPMTLFPGGRRLG